MRLTPDSTTVDVRHVSQVDSVLDAERAGVSASKLRAVATSAVASGTLTRVSVDDFWFEAVLDDAWVVAYRIVSQPEGLVVGEIRIFPADERSRDRRTRRGEWSGGLLGTRAEAPQGNAENWVGGSYVLTHMQSFIESEDWTESDNVYVTSYELTAFGKRLAGACGIA